VGVAARVDGVVQGVRGDALQKGGAGGQRVCLLLHHHPIPLLPPRGGRGGCARPCGRTAIICIHVCMYLPCTAQRAQTSVYYLHTPKKHMFLRWGPGGVGGGSTSGPCRAGPAGHCCHCWRVGAHCVEGSSDWGDDLSPGVTRKRPGASCCDHSTTFSTTGTPPVKGGPVPVPAAVAVPAHVCSICS
jgi:hypothetical protein